MPIRLRHGQRISVDEILPAEAEIAVFDSDSVLVAIAVADSLGRGLRPAKVFPA